ncbi:hypothetical protein [Rhizobium sp. K102]|uniref:hypothetical protein n=1 Tax=Rhizobium sp. K102 TaxID=2918527 RepID=UPI001EFABB9D|nr:hypothetical protein [Rhizobium sp. K102]ULR43208.1 hypothetical protein MHI61_18545 [Rhizobium sp. K102]
MSLFSPLSPWLDRREFTPPFEDILDVDLDDNRGCHVGLDAWMPVYEAHALKAQSLTDSWHAVRSYVSKACDLIGTDEPVSLDNEDREMILESCGEPPRQAYPLYFITTRETKGEDVIVYIGKTSSRSKRFSGGHAAISKLHAPKFQSADKRLYLGCVTFVDRKGKHAPLEMMQPLHTAQMLLADLEMQLIYHFQPELNTKGKQNQLSRLEQTVQIQGLDDGDDYFIHPGERSIDFR